MDHLEHDRLEHELRDVLTSPRRTLSPELVPLDRVHSGAMRRRRRRHAAVAAGCAVLLAAIAVPASLMLRDGSRSVPPLTTASTRHPTANVAPPSTRPSATPSPAIQPTGPAWNGASVLSVTATSEQTFVALGAVKVCSSATPSSCLRLAQSTNGGRTFTSLAVPAGVQPGGGNPTTSSVLDVRFGSAADGWLFGDGLWSTHDGGASWAKQRLPGRVMRLEAAAGTAWALVTDGIDSVTTSLWRSPVGSDDWTRVPDVSLRYAVDLSVHARHVVAVGGRDSKAWVGESGKFTATDNPCPGGTGLSPRLSATTSIWASCVDGTSARLLTSADGAGWAQVVPSFLPDALPNQAVVGARTAGDALLAVGPDEPFYRVRVDGSGAPVKHSPTSQGATSYIGFTSSDTGYAITGFALWRTSDGGDTWARVRVR